MPYISEDLRKQCDDTTWEGPLPPDPGQLNYRISKLIDRYFGGRLNYIYINDVIGVLECCKQEVYRRIASKYEDEKIKSNGDVFLTSRYSPNENS